MLVIIGLSLTCCVNARAFNFSYDTYATDSGVLILNSLGDQVTNSHYGALGSNDFISENAYKNDLKLDGYTVAYDYNPQNTNPQFSADYNTPLPNGGAGLTKLQFAGFEGNPRATQDVYVLTSEYDSLSAQGQANSISSLTTSTTTLTNDMATIVSQTNTNTTNISTLGNVVNNQEVQITNNANNISTVNQVQTAWNQNQDNEITGLQNTAQSQQKQINGLNNRVGALERTQDIVGAQLRLYDTRKWQVNAFLDYTTTRATVQEVGIRFTYKLGKSYEEQRIDDLENEIKKLSGDRATVEANKTSMIYYTGNGVGMRTNF